MNDNQVSEAEFESICAELEELVKRPRTEFVKLRIKRLIKRAGMGETAKKLFKRRR